MLKFLLVLLPFVFIQVHAVELDTNYVTFNLSKRDIGMSHNELSPVTNFKSVDRTYTIPVFSLKIGLEKEIFEKQPISFTLGGGVGGMFGKKNKDFLERDIQVSDKVVGTFYNFSGTVNYNFMWQKMRTQVFGGLNIVKSDTKYKLKYTPFSNGTPQYNIDYKEDGSQSLLTAGMRFFDSKVGLFSIISLEYKMTSIFKSNQIAAKIDGANVEIYPGFYRIDHKPLVINLGFGITF